MDALQQVLGPHCDEISIPTGPPKIAPKIAAMHAPVTSATDAPIIAPSRIPTAAPTLAAFEVDPLTKNSPVPAPHPTLKNTIDVAAAPIAPGSETVHRFMTDRPMPGARKAVV